MARVLYIPRLSAPPTAQVIDLATRLPVPTARRHTTAAARLAAHAAAMRLEQQASRTRHISNARPGSPV